MQISILKKKLRNIDLTRNEKTYYYKYIKPKILAMRKLLGLDNIIICGKEHIINERINKAVDIMHKIEHKHKNKKIMITGSFLFNKEYNDIDVFIFTKYTKQDYVKGKLHINYFPESTINALFFASISKISISNFQYENKENFDINIDNVLRSYENIIYMLETKQINIQDIRTFLITTEYYSKKVVLNPKQLSLYTKSIFERKIYEKITQKLINDLMILYDVALKKKLEYEIKQMKELLKKYNNAENFRKCITVYQKVIKLAE
jgi:hypothetical protein